MCPQECRKAVDFVVKGDESAGTSLYAVFQGQLVEQGACASGPRQPRQRCPCVCKDVAALLMVADETASCTNLCYVSNHIGDSLRSIGFGLQAQSCL